jgi:hypothetical protein
MMGQRHRLLVGAALALVIVPNAASAQSIADVLGQWGLLGTWSADCRAPAQQAARVSYVRQSDGNAQHIVDFGDQRGSTSPILAARPEPNGDLQITVNQQREVITYVLTRGDGDTVRSMSSRRPNGEYYIRDGRFVASGATSPWMSRCR